MRKTGLFFVLFIICLYSRAQSPDTINVEEVRRIVTYLASDSLKGRGNHTPELFKAAHFIASEFEKDSLGFFPQSSTYFHPFSIREVERNKNKSPVDSGTTIPVSEILLNVIGILPGKSKPGEAVIFSAHYDHMGTTGKRIHPGANDNASGTTAVLMLAKYFSMRRDNERTLVFVAFAGEELGLYGSQYLVNHIAVEKIVAMVNIEMIGKADRKKTFFLTGGYLSDLEKIMRKNLKETDFRMIWEPSEDKRLFERSDNYPFARNGVPAHTIMSSDDSDPCYHQPCDVAAKLDLENMTRIIKAIAIGVRTIVDGTDTPKRIRHSKVY